MRQNDYERTQEIISMEEYLEKRQENRKTDFLKRPKNSRTADWSTALELAAMYM